MRPLVLCLVAIVLSISVPFWGRHLSADGKAAGANEAKDTAKAFVYPGAKRFWDEFDGAGIHSARFTTVAEFAKVAAWYKGKMEFDGIEGISVNRGMVAGIRTSVVENSRQPGPNEMERGKERPVNVVVCFRKTNDLCVNAIVSRAKGEKVTHIVLTVVDNKRQ